MKPRRHPFPGNQLIHVDNMGAGDSAEPDMEEVAKEVRTPTDNLDAAMLLTSQYGGADSRWHRPVLDIDMGVRVVESSPGRHHLTIDHLMSWPEYEKLLEALAEAGIVEPGYVNVARVRGHTAVRVPWFRKGDPAPDIDGNVPAEPW